MRERPRERERDGVGIDRVAAHHEHAPALGRRGRGGGAVHGLLVRVEELLDPPQRRGRVRFEQQLGPAGFGKVRAQRRVAELGEEALVPWLERVVVKLGALDEPRPNGRFGGFAQRLGLARIVALPPLELRREHAARGVDAPPRRRGDHERARAEAERLAAERTDPSAFVARRLALRDAALREHAVEIDAAALRLGQCVAVPQEHDRAAVRDQARHHNCVSLDGDAVGAPRGTARPRAG